MYIFSSKYSLRATYHEIFSLKTVTILSPLRFMPPICFFQSSHRIYYMRARFIHWTRNIVSFSKWSVSILNEYSNVLFPFFFCLFFQFINECNWVKLSVGNYSHCIIIVSRWKISFPGPALSFVVVVLNNSFFSLSLGSSLCLFSVELLCHQNN